MRKRKLEKTEKTSGKIFKVEVVEEEQLELREDSPKPSIHHHHLPLSPISLSSEPSSPTPSDGSHSNYSTSPELQGSQKEDSNLKLFTDWLMKQLTVNETVGE